MGKPSKVTQVVAQKGRGFVINQWVNITGREFIAPERPINHPDDPFTKAKITQQLNDRLKDKTYPNQNQSSLCGPAAFFYCLQLADKPAYAKIVWELWHKGKGSIYNLNIKVPRQTGHPRNYFNTDGTPKLLGIDWITLGGLRGSSNTLLAYDSPDNEMSAITARSMLISWFEEAGFILKESFVRNTVLNHQVINGHIGLRNHYVVSLVDSALIDNERNVRPSIPNHWVVWSSPLSHLNGNMIGDSTKNDDKVKMTCFSWGKRNNPLRINCTYGEFKALHYFCYVFIKS